MTDIGPYSNYRLTVRLELANTPGMFAKVAAVLAEEGANLGTVDIVSATADCLVRDVTFDVQSEAHGEKVLARVGALPDVTVLSASDRIFCCISAERFVSKVSFPSQQGMCSRWFIRRESAGCRTRLRRTRPKPMPLQARATRSPW